MQKGKKDFRDLLIVIIGIAGMICYFFTMSGVHPFRVTQVDVPPKEILAKADSVLKNWQYQTQSFYPVANFQAESGFMDSLQKKTGKKKLDEFLEESEFFEHLPIFTWRVNEVYNEEVEEEITLDLRLDTQGRVAAFNSNEYLILEQRPFNRTAIQHVYQEEIPNYPWISPIFHQGMNHHHDY